ncbi:hypothetical protein B0F90DRAFT_1667828 [Multifurca ochricompacta]|uniref:Uncharacterized protein n=1 Tax=Multifurca ochricompacta TaxID=376703 RepID=A0AAD4M4E8_9AGAM|nr:hypothetical protein B0F90DRAFT_1667828 [Multifurca ochricompacta]
MDSLSSSSCQASISRTANGDKNHSIASPMSSASLSYPLSPESSSVPSRPASNNINSSSSIRINSSSGGSGGDSPLIQDEMKKKAIAILADSAVPEHEQNLSTLRGVALDWPPRPPTPSTTAILTLDELPDSSNGSLPEYEITEEWYERIVEDLREIEDEDEVEVYVDVDVNAEVEVEVEVGMGDPAPQQIYRRPRPFTRRLSHEMQTVRDG